MASGDSLNHFHPLGAERPASAYPTLGVRNNHPVLEFDATADEECYFTDVLSLQYDSGGVTVDLHVAAATATSGASRWEVAFERLGAQDFDSNGFATAKSVGITANGTSGIPTVGSIAFSNGSEMDSVVAGELFRLLVRRDANATTGTDDMTGDAQLALVIIRET